MNELKVFHNSEFGKLEIITIDGKEYFPATQCAKILGYAKPADAVRKHCKGVSILETPTNGGIQKVGYIPEGDLYRLIISSKLPSARKFERWVFDEVLPEIRKTGGYGNISIEEFITKTVSIAVSETIKAIMPMFEKPAPDIISDVYDSEPPSRRTHSIISRLDTELRTAVDDMILSRKYTYEEIKEFLAEQGVAVSMSSIQRYKTSLYRKG